MNILTVFVFTLAIAATRCSILENETIEERKSKFVKFYKCISCEYETEAFWEYTECKKLKSQKSTEIFGKCKDRYISQANNEEEDMIEICKNPEVLGKMFDCLVAETEATGLTEEEKESLESFIRCARSVYKSHCKE
ncbi:uncharacterized protein LOC118203935 [Stegodyphus dumicola]|uniref:uncharacterized protein LOC118203935 n=1 Tax=Stegodyphus dumicola TaxID=202533 RepID=UPI0015AF16B9|nr:uncharacterized protein LOC118203935 [Stegodyphus dumicola]